MQLDEMQTSLGQLLEYTIHYANLLHSIFWIYFSEHSRIYYVTFQDFRGNLSRRRIFVDMNKRNDRKANISSNELTMKYPRWSVLIIPPRAMQSVRRFAVSQINGTNGSLSMGDELSGMQTVFER